MEQSTDARGRHPADAVTPGQPLCVVGMHRSGTSMMARMVSEASVYFGTHSELAHRDHGNPEGYWEDPRFLAINERLLNAGGADWDFPVEGAASSPGEWREEEARAAALVSEFAPHGTWGWKDPRTSLTLGFWMHLLPGLRAVVCVRNPLEVANSLRDRNGFSLSHGLNLWLTYNRRILDALPPDRRVVVHYDACFVDPAAELERVTRRFALPATEAMRATAAATFRRGHRHHRRSAQHLREVSVSTELLDLYLALCEEADWDDEARERWNRSERMRASSPSGPAGAPQAPWSRRGAPQINLAALELERIVAGVRELHAQLDAARAHTQQQDAQLGAQQAELSQLRTQISQLQDAVAQGRASLEQRTAELVGAQAHAADLGDALTRAHALQAETSRQAQALEDALRSAQQEWEQIRAGAGWSLLEGAWRWRKRLLPHGSRTDHALQHGLRLGRSLKSRLGRGTRGDRGPGR